MSRTAAKITQADVARALRAAKQVGAGRVLVLTDGTIQIDVQASNAVEQQQKTVADEEEAVL